MLIFPAIDLYEGMAVRLYKGDYNQKNVYSSKPENVALDFKALGAEYIHLVDLEGAKSGDTPNLDKVLEIKSKTGLFCEIGGGIRSMDTVKKYLENGLDRVILGTAAINDEKFLDCAVEKYGEKIAVGIDIRDGYVAINGWTEKTDTDAFSFCRKMQQKGVNTFICTDISKDGAMAGTNRKLYEEMKKEFKINITASGGVSTLEDVIALKNMGIYGAIIGKAYYTGSIDLREAIEVAR